jgi:DNA-binding CsgD family transcriptional regulator
VAEVTAERALEEADLIGRGELIELLGDAELALGRGEAAAARARALLDAIDDPGCEIVRARGQRLLGRAIAAREPLDAAIAGFARLTMPYEVARTRLLLAEVVRHTEPELTRSEARTALSAFEDLDAGRDADAAAAFLRALGVKAARLGPRGLNALTKRETEVLQLVAEGLSNPEIAQRLYLSRKTVEHHVASILTKLGAKNRADALRIAARAAPTADPVTG